MAETTIPASEFTRHFGRDRMLAQREAVAVSSHGSITGYFVAPDEYEEFRRFKHRLGCLKIESGVPRSRDPLARNECSYRGAALSPLALDSFETSDASTMTPAITAIAIVQMALISGFTPSRTSE